MKNVIKKSLQSLLIVPVLALGVSFVAPALQATPAYAACDTSSLSLQKGADCAQGTDQQGTASCLFGGGAGCSGDGIFKTVTNVLLFIIGAISVIMLIIGGIRYVVSGGDSGAITSAKNTILYAIVGIVVAILAYALVNFVITSFAGK
jgi:hypothetical protein